MSQDNKKSMVMYQGDGSNKVFAVPMTKGKYGTISVAFVRRGLDNYEYNPTTWTLNDENTLLTWTGDVLNVGDYIVIERTTARKQPYEFPNNQKHIERSDDNLERQIQEVADAADRALKLDPTYSIDSDKMNPIEWLQTIVRCKDLTVRGLRFANNVLQYSKDDPEKPESEKTWYSLLNTDGITNVRERYDVGTDTYYFEYSTDGGSNWKDVGEMIRHNGLQGRDEADCHPISAITGLQDKLDEKATGSDTYTKTEVDEKLNLKADKATTLQGYGITDAYTKAETDNKLSEKLNTESAEETYATKTELSSHTENTDNPHNVTKAQVGLGNVDNTSDLSKPISTATQSALDLKANSADVYTKSEVDSKLVEKLDTSVASTTYATIATVDTKADADNVYDKATVDEKLNAKLDSTTASTTYATQTTVNGHISDTNNPHNVTKAQVGLGNVDNTSDLNKPISTATQNALNGKLSIKQNPQDAGKVVKVGSDGNLEFSSESSGGGLQSVSHGATLKGAGTDLQPLDVADGSIGNTQLAEEVKQEIAGKQPAGNYATEEELVQGLAGKQPTGDYATNTALQQGLATKQPVGNYATEDELTQGLATKQPTGDYATNAALTQGLASKQDKGDYATKTDLAGKADKATTLAGYGITDGATKTELNTKLSTVATDGKTITGNGTTADPLTVAKSGTGLDIGDIIYTTRTDNELSGKVECNGAQYNFADVNGGNNNVQALLESGALPSVSIAKFDEMVAEQGGCDSFGYGTDTKWNAWDAMPGYVYTNTTPTAVGDPVYDSPGGNIIGHITRIDSEDRTCIYYDATDGTSGFGYADNWVYGPVEPTTYFKVPKKVGRVLVRCQKPTADNNYTWFNLYSDGWVEQGGIITNTKNLVTITFPIEFADTNYLAIKNAATNDTATISWRVISFYNQTTTQATTFNSLSASGIATWYASGYAAASEYTPDKWDYQNVQVERPMVQLFNSATDEAVAKCTEVLSDVAGLKLNKADTDLSNVSSNIDYVVESQDPTEANGYTWYRLYKSGWVEQGGVISIVKGVTNVTLPVEMNDTNYLVSMSAGNGNPASQYAGAYKWDRTSTTIISLTNDNTGTITFSWLVLGQSAQ